MASSLRTGGTTFTFTPYIPQSGPSKNIINFRAFINSISDSFSPQWSEHMDMGRADPKFMYTQFSRNLSIDFKIAALNKEEHIKNMNAMNSLSSLTYPIYKSGRGFNGIYVKIQIGEFIKSIGLISSLTFNVDNETPWIDDLPLYIDCSLDFRHIGDKKPDYKKPQNSGPYFKGKFELGIK